MPAPDAHLVVVGGSLAGLRAVESARKAGHAGPVTLVGAEPHPPYDRPPLSKQVLAAGDVDERFVQPYRSEADLVGELGVELLLGSPATGLDLAGRTLVVGARDLSYDALVLATGATPRTLPGPLPRGVVTLRTRDDAAVVREALDAGVPVVVVGAGFVGLEVASAVRDRGAAVTVLEASPHPLARSVGEEAAALVLTLVSDAGVDLRTGVEVVGFSEEGGAVNGVRLGDGTEVAAGLVVVGIGAAPATGWLRGSGLELAPDGGVACDATLRAAEGVWAAGDVASVATPTGPRRTEHWTNAHEQGRLAGTNAAAWLRGEAAAEHVTVPYVWSDVHGSKLQLLGRATGADRTEVLGDATGPWLALYADGDRFAGVLVRDLPGRVMKFRPLLARGASYDEALELARSKPLPS